MLALLLLHLKKTFLSKETSLHFWKGDVALATLSAGNGYEIVNSLHSETYLDYDYKAIPLSRAYAEVGWTEKEHKNFDNFESALQHLKRGWEEKGIYYAPDSALE